MADSRLNRPTLTVEYLKSILRYDPDTGIFTWLESRRRSKAGQVAGISGVSHGYSKIGIDQREYPAHRLAWYYVYGEWPPALVDHINLDRSDNRLANLRLASRAQNTFNAGKRLRNKSGLKGVCHGYGGKFNAFISFKSKSIYLGTFVTAEDAHDAYKEAAKQYFGEFANAG